MQATALTIICEGHLLQPIITVKCESSAHNTVAYNKKKHAYFMLLLMNDYWPRYDKLINQIPLQVTLPIVTQYQAVRRLAIPLAY